VGVLAAPAPQLEEGPSKVLGRAGFHVLGHFCAFQEAACRTRSLADSCQVGKAGAVHAGFHATSLNQSVEVVHATATIPRATHDTLALFMTRV
jgi:hypothetical protein